MRYVERSGAEFSKQSDKSGTESTRLYRINFYQCRRNSVPCSGWDGRTGGKEEKKEEEEEKEKEKECLMYRRVSGELKPNPQEVWTRLGGANRSRLSDASRCACIHTHTGGLSPFSSKFITEFLGNT